MILLITRPTDPLVAALRAALAPGAVAVMDVETGPLASWHFEPGAAERSALVVDGRRVVAGELTAVLSRLPWVDPARLEAIVPDDRAYVAAETSASLVAWLAALPCPVLNRPTPACLVGPAWAPQQWALAAARAGLRVAAVEERAARGGRCAEAAPSPVRATRATVTVVGGRCVGEVAPALVAGALRLATEARVALLGVSFDGAEADAHFLGATPTPDLDTPAALHALVARLRG